MTDDEAHRWTERIPFRDVIKAMRPDLIFGTNSYAQISWAEETERQEAMQWAARAERELTMIPKWTDRNWILATRHSVSTRCVPASRPVAGRHGTMVIETQQKRHRMASHLRIRACVAKLRGSDECPDGWF